MLLSEKRTFRSICFLKVLFVVMRDWKGGYGYFNPYIPRNFNPHLPRRRWRMSVISKVCRIWFQSTPSSQKATAHHVMTFTWYDISIHTFLAEGDGRAVAGGVLFGDFNPHLPCRRRQVGDSWDYSGLKFQSTPSSQKATLATLFTGIEWYISIHTFLAEGDKKAAGEH